MLPLIPLAISLATATALAIHKLKKNDGTLHSHSTLSDIQNWLRQDYPEVSFSTKEPLNPDYCLPDGTPLLVYAYIEGARGTVSMSHSNHSYFEYLLMHGANPSVHDKDGMPLLNLAVNDTRAREFLLLHGASPNEMDKMGRTALFYARSSDAVLQLISAGADPNVLDIEGQTPLFHARDGALIQPLIRAGVDVNAKDIYGKTVLFYLNPQSASDWLFAKWMVENGCDPNIKDNSNRLAPMHYRLKGISYQKDVFYDAIETGDNDLIKKLITEGRKPTIDHCCVAINNNNPQTLQLLIDEGVHVGESNPDLLNTLRNRFYNDASLHSSSPQENQLSTATLKVLLDEGVILESLHLCYLQKRVQTDNEMLEMIANYPGCYREANEDLIALMLANCTDPNRCLPGGTPLLFEIARNTGIKNLKALVSALQNLPIDVNYVDESGKTALFYAKTPTIIKALIELGINVDALDKQGRTPLFEITPTRYNSYALTKAMLNAGIDPSIKDIFGNTATIEVATMDYIGKLDSSESNA